MKTIDGEDISDIQHPGLPRLAQRWSDSADAEQRPSFGAMRRARPRNHAQSIITHHKHVGTSSNEGAFPPGNEGGLPVRPIDWAPALPGFLRPLKKY